MKKILILALFVLGMCNASAFGMTQEIILTELYSIIPLDDPGYEGRGAPFANAETGVLSGHSKVTRQRQAGEQNPGFCLQPGAAESRADG